MSKIEIQLSKQLKQPIDGMGYVLNLEKVVEDLLSTSFNKCVNLFHTDDRNGIYYNINYGASTRRDSSGVQKENGVYGYEIDIKSLKQLQKHIKKAKQKKSPDFRVQYVDIEINDLNTSFEQFFWWTCLTSRTARGYYERIRTIKLQERDSSTHLTTQLNDNGLVKIQFKYNQDSYPSEISRVEKGVAELQKRGYTRIDNSVELGSFVGCKATTTQ